MLSTGFFSSGGDACIDAKPRSKGSAERTMTCSFAGTVAMPRDETNADSESTMRCVAATTSPAFG